MPYQVVSRTTDPNDAGNPGPRVIFSNSDTDVYLTIGAWAGTNNLVSVAGRPIVITMPAGLCLKGLTTAPPGTSTTDLCVDANGNVYKQT